MVEARLESERRPDKGRREVSRSRPAEGLISQRRGYTSRDISINLNAVYKYRRIIGK